METILKTGYWKIMKLFYDVKEGEIHLREIVRRTGLNENSVTRFLKNLESEEILISRKEGNLKKYGIVRSEIVYSIFQIMDIKKFEKLPSLRKRAVSYFLSELSEQPIIGLLFGSTSKETFSKNSDVDLLLIVNKKMGTKKAEHYSEAQTGLRISVFQIDYIDFVREIKLRYDKVIQSAVKTGYPILNHIKFYEVLLNGD